MAQIQQWIDCFQVCFLLFIKKKANVKLEKEQKTGHVVNVPVHQGWYPVFEIVQQKSGLENRAVNTSSENPLILQQFEFQELP